MARNFGSIQGQVAYTFLTSGIPARTRKRKSHAFSAAVFTGAGPFTHNPPLSRPFPLLKIHSASFLSDPHFPSILRSLCVKTMERNNSLVMRMAIIVFIWLCLGKVIAQGEGHRPMLKEKVTHLRFYMHDIILGKNATVVQVAPQTPMNISGGSPFFGPVYVIDDPLTKTPHPKSKLVGRAQGLYAMSSQGEFSLLMALTYSIESGKFKGSSLSVVGKNMVMRKQREMPIVGGSGHFRMARGYAFAETHSIDGPNAVIGYNVTVFHYEP